MKELCITFLDGCTKRSKDWFVVGLGQDSTKQTLFLVCAYPEGTALRKRLGLPSKDFHITIGFGEGGDVHGCGKGLRSLVLPRSRIFPAFSTPTTLVEVAKERILGGEPQALVDNGKRINRDFRGASILADAAEALVPFVHQSVERAVEKMEILHLNGSELVLLRKMLHMRCILKGRQGDFKRVADLSLCLLNVHVKIGDKDTGHSNKAVKASAEGYRGFALAKMGIIFNTFSLFMFVKSPLLAPTFLLLHLTLLDTLHLDVEAKLGIRWDVRLAPLLPITKLAGDDQLPLTAHPHPKQTLIPSLDYIPSAQSEGE